MHNKRNNNKRRSRRELKTINAIAKELGVPANINLRLAGFPIKHITSRAITTSGDWSKFGIDVKRASSVFQEVLDMDMLIPNGLMVHLGSQITDITAYHIVLDALINLSRDAQRIGFGIKEIDRGGGLGVQYFGLEDRVVKVANSYPS